MKSNVSDHLELLHAVYLDACSKCTAVVSDLRDLDVARSRTEKEGLSFLTITLPNFCRDFERSLSRGRIDSADFRSFRKSGAIPAFLQGMLSQLFSRETGDILDETPDSSVLVEGVRQICLLFKKVLVPCSPERVSAALESFIQIERDNEFFAVPEKQLDIFTSVSRVLWDSVLGDIRLDMLLPRHGPGATAERISGNQKYVWRRWHERLEPYFPFLGSGYSISACEKGLDDSEGEDDLLSATTFVPEQEEDPVRVVFVPKTLKSPRTIAIEPVCMQYAQQAIQSFLYERLESHPLTRGQVNFTDQTVNQRLALDSSRTGRYATIDLSDASDRVLHTLAMEMFRGTPDLSGAIEACRSRSALLPTGDILSPLFKFASMGSALCFPVEAMVFYTICIVARLAYHNLPVSYASVKLVCKDIYVYGDDIIVPTDEAEAVLDHLQYFHCKVNSSKTFYTGKFRESCGLDAYAGKEVTPTYLRRMRPENRQQASELISWIATANLLYLKGYWRAAELMFSTCEQILGSSLPYVSVSSSALGRVSFLGYRSAEKWDDSHHSFKLRAWVPKAVVRSDSIDGYPALQKCLLSLERRSRQGPAPERIDTSVWESYARGVIPFSADDTHLEQTALRGAVTLKRRWVPIT